MNTAGEQNAKQAFLSLQNLEKIYPNGEKAVYNFNLDIEKNEFLVIVGPSGCGKTTTLRMVAGLEDISSGDIFLEGELLNYKPCKDRRMAIVFQSYALYPQMKVFDNIAFPLTINRYEAPVTDECLQSCFLLRSLMRETDAQKLFEILCGILGGKGGARAKAESLAEVFSLTYECAKRLIALCKKYKKQSAQQLLSQKEQIFAEWEAQIGVWESAERGALQQKGIHVDEKFCELDENGAVKMQMRKLTPYEIKVKVYETADKLDLTPYLDKLPKELSGGQMQRVALGRAIVKNVPIFLMDEPLSNLDAKLRLTMRSEIVKLHNRIHATTIYVTHDQTEAMTMASRIVVMSKGFVQQIGTPEVIYNDPANIFVARFIGSPSMNVFNAKFERASSRFRFGSLEIAAGKDFAQRCAEFYRRKEAELSAMLDNFDEAAHESMLKLLSVTGEYAEKRRKTAEKNSLWANLKRRVAKSPAQDRYAFEREVCARKLEEVRRRLDSDCELTLGIRPENLRIRMHGAGETEKNAVTVRPTVCELLGGEYNIHFDYNGMGMVGQVDAKNKISPQDEIDVLFPAEDVYVFDPITGDRIR